MTAVSQHLSAGLLAVVRYADWLSRLFWPEGSRKFEFLVRKADPVPASRSKSLNTESPLKL